MPNLINLNDIRGDLKCRTRASSGDATLEAIVAASIAKGYNYIAITDHAKHLHGLKGLEKKDLLAQIKKIDKLNSQPARLDLNDVNCKLAKEIGTKIVIPSDAHSIQELDFMLFGIFQAQRGWLEKTDVLNTKPLTELLKSLKR